MDFEFSGTIFEWRGPAPHHFIDVPDEECADISELAAEVTYGWGMIPVRLRLGESEWETSLWPRNGRYVVPLKLAVRRAEGVGTGDTVAIGLAVVTRS